MTQLIQRTIEHDFCPHCQNYIDKRFIYKDYESGAVMPMGSVKDCKYHTDTSWLCDFKEIKDEKDN